MVSGSNGMRIQMGRGRQTPRDRVGGGGEGPGGGGEVEACSGHTGNEGACPSAIIIWGVREEGIK